MGLSSNNTLIQLSIINRKSFNTLKFYNIVLLSLVFITFANCQSREKDTFNNSSNNTSYSFIEVPANRAKPNSSKLRLAYKVLKANTKSNMPPIIFLQGGPGASSLYLENFWKSTILNKDHDIILVDQRGTGFSSSICEDAYNEILNILSANLNAKEEEEELLALSKFCKEDFKAKSMDFRVFNTLDNAEDLELLREHLDIPKWIILAGSYGTRLGLQYLKKYQGNTHAAILMGLYGPNVKLYNDFVDVYIDKLELIFNECENDPYCNRKYPDLKSQFYKNIDNLKEVPFKLSYNEIDIYINTQNYLLYVHQLLYSKITLQLIPKFIYSFPRYDEETIAKGIGYTLRTIKKINIAAFWSYIAYEESYLFKSNYKFLPNTNERFDAEISLFSAEINILKEWSHDFSEPLGLDDLAIKTPLLIINGRFDPVTPLEKAKELMPYFENAFLLDFPNEGHSIFNSCSFKSIEEFIKNPKDNIESSCKYSNKVQFE